ncbi:MAG TPA: acylphosphatase [Candidatus Limnocylindria bacterium]|nr:acylphosphatase [Candidatus Limnocylindria bacterium]
MPADNPRVRLQARVVGRVQGVGYRYWLLHRATDAGLTGWVRNLPDERSLELLVEGGATAIEALERALWTGPPGARVDRVEASRSAASGEYDHFSVGGS